MLESICYGFIYLFEALACFLFFENIYFRKEEINNTLFYLTYVFAFIVQYGISFAGIPVLNLVVFIICNTVIALVCYETKIKTATLTSLVLTVLMFITEMIVVYFSSMVLKIDINAYENDILVLVTQSSLSKLLFFMAIFFISKIIKFKFFRTQYDKYTIMLGFFPLVTIIIMNFLTYFEINYNVIEPYNTVLTACSILLLFANILVFYVYEMVQKANEENLQLQLERQYVEISSEYYNLLASEYENSRVLIHDIKNHLRHIENKAAEGEATGVTDYIDTIREEFGLNERIRYSGSCIIDVIINRYHGQCKEAGVTFEVEACCSKLDFMADNDIIALLGNLFDNSLEAAKGTKEKKVVFAAYIRNDDYIHIEMKNSCDNPPRTIAGKLITSKGNIFHHGYGTKSIRRVLRKYDGKFKWTYDEKKKLFGTVCVVKIREVKKNRPALPLLLPKDHPEVKRMEEVMGMNSKTE